VVRYFLWWVCGSARIVSLSVTRLARGSRAPAGRALAVSTGGIGAIAQPVQTSALGAAVTMPSITLLADNAVLATAGTAKASGGGSVQSSIGDGINCPCRNTQNKGLAFKALWSLP